MEKVAALGDMTKDMASRVREGANLQGLTKVTLRSKVIPLDLKKAVSCKTLFQFILSSFNGETKRVLFMLSLLRKRDCTWLKLCVICFVLSWEAFFDETRWEEYKPRIRFNCFSQLCNYWPHLQFLKCTSLSLSESALVQKAATSRFLSDQIVRRKNT